MVDYKSIPINELIPHSPPMVLIENILDFTQTSLVAEITIVENCMFYDMKNCGVPTWVGIEYMAQSIAAFAGIQAKMISEPIKLGFLLGTRRYTILYPFFLVGNNYKIHVNKLYMDDSGLASFDCYILNNQEKIVEARLNVFETDNAQQIVDR